MGKQTRKQRFGPGRVLHTSFVVVKIPQYRPELQTNPQGGDPITVDVLTSYKTLMTKRGKGSTYENLERTLKKDKRRTVVIQKPARRYSIYRTSHPFWISSRVYQCGQLTAFTILPSRGSAYYAERRAINRTGAILDAVV